MFDVSSHIGFESDEQSIFKVARVANRVVCFEMLFILIHIL